MGRVALVTGGIRGIGETISINLQEKGYKVVANYSSSDSIASMFTEKTGIPTYRFNVADEGAVEDGIGKIEAEIGPVDILVNNAGITRDKTLHKMHSDDWLNVIQTNLTSCYNTCRMLINGMRERKFGRIINISSINGQAGQYGQTNYSAAKAGMIGFTKALAQEGAAHGITANVIAPGYVETEMIHSVPEKILEKIISAIPVGRLGKPKDVARAVAFLADDDAGFITGSTLTINGGQYMS